MARIVLATLGSLGDLHPFIAVGLRLKERGYDAIVAASPDFRDNVTGEGLAFHPVGPTRREVLGDLGIDLDELGRRMIKDTIFALEAGCFPYLQRMYDDVLPAIEGASLVLTSTLMYSARMAAEKLNIPQMTVALQPMVFLSAYDPPAVSPAPWLASVLAKLGPAATRVVYGAGRKSVIPRGRPLYAFRRQIGLPDTKANPLFEGQFTSFGTLALYSPCLGAIQPDFPPHTTITGFTFYDRVAHQQPTLAPQLEAFLSSGPPPLVFTLGSIAVEFPGDFYRVSAEAARRLKRRAVLLVGREGMETYRNERSPDIFVGDYAPFSELFPCAAAVVHHGGVGTLGQALRAGKPQLVVPLYSDQFDNAARVVRLGVARSIGSKRYVPTRVAVELTRLLERPNYAARAAAVGNEVGRENGAEVAARILDDFLRMPARRIAV
jgi:UDP:flavonoid glycosyltransferase YjiC (YdhE family)